MSDLDFGAGAPVHGDLDVRWIHGSPRGTENADPPIQVHRYDPHTYVLRQSKALTAEAPFLYLLFGNERAVLFDTGASKKTAGNPLRETVDGIVESWLAEHPRDGYELIVAHTHGHLDHVEGDAQFADRPATTVVDRELEAVQAFYGFTAWPEQIVDSTSAAASSSSPAPRGTSVPRSRSTTRGAGSCSPATTRCRAGSTRSTSPPTSTAWSGRSSSLARARSRT